MGLSVHVSKCELIIHPGCSVTDPTLLSFQQVSVQQVSVADVEVLGAPLFPSAVVDGAWSRRCGDFARAVDRLASIGSSVAFIPLMASFNAFNESVYWYQSFSASKALHLLRCSHLLTM